jgi:hypothetical protein
MASQLSKQELYEAVKIMVEAEQHRHVHLTQHKLFTLFSIAFQYMLYTSTKKPGVYIIRVEDSSLAEKLARKSKDLSTKKFIQSLLLTRKLKYGKSTFLLDFFNISSWSLAGQVPPDKFKAALIVKNTSAKPMSSLAGDDDDNADGEKVFESSIIDSASFPKDYYRTSLMEVIPRTITIAYGEELEGTSSITFPFIKNDQRKALAGVKISEDIDFDALED